MGTQNYSHLAPPIPLYAQWQKNDSSTISVTIGRSILPKRAKHLPGYCGGRICDISPSIGTNSRTLDLVKRTFHSASEFRPVIIQAGTNQYFADYRWTFLPGIDWLIVRPDILPALFSIFLERIKSLDQYTDAVLLLGGNAPHQIDTILHAAASYPGLLTLRKIPNMDLYALCYHIPACNQAK